SLQHLVAGTADFKTRLFLFVGRVFYNHARLSRNFVYFLVERHTFLQVLELNVTRDFGKNCEGKRIPCSQELILIYATAVLDENMRTINNLVTRRLTTTVIDDYQ